MLTKNDLRWISQEMMKEYDNPAESTDYKRGLHVGAAILWECLDKKDKRPIADELFGKY